MFLAVAAVHAGMMILLVFSKIRLDFSTTLACYQFTVPFLLCLAYARWRRMELIYAPLESVISIVLSIVPVTISTYLAIGLNMPLADQQLIAMDKAIGFDWFAFITYVDTHPALSKLLAFAYSSFFLQLLLLPVYLGLFGRPSRAYAMVFAYILICVFASLISIWYPAHGTYAVYGITDNDLSNINPHFGYFFLEQFNAVREMPFFLLDFVEAAGILTFPSVHAGVAALCVWAAWGSRLLRYPVLLLNIAMCLSAVSHANHYMIDVVAGVGLAAFCIAISHPLFFSRNAERPSLVLMVCSRMAGALTARRKNATSHAATSD